MTVITVPPSPATIGTRTAELRQGYLFPPKLRPTRNEVELAIIRIDPIQSTEVSLGRISVLFVLVSPQSMDVSLFIDEGLSPANTAFPSGVDTSQSTVGVSERPLMFSGVDIPC